MVRFGITLVVFQCCGCYCCYTLAMMSNMLTGDGVTFDVCLFFSKIFQ